jgi:hypothetical protein
MLSRRPVNPLLYLFLASLCALCFSACGPSPVGDKSDDFPFEEFGGSTDSADEHPGDEPITDPESDGNGTETEVDGADEIEPIPDIEPVPIEDCKAISQGSLWHEEGPISFDNHELEVSAEHNGSERCVTTLSLVFSKGGKCPFTIEFGSKNGVWALQKATLRSDMECADGWGSGKTYVAYLDQSQATLLGVPDPVDVGNGEQSCTPLDSNIELVGTLIVEAGGTVLELGLTNLSVQGKLLTDAVSGGSCGASPPLCANLACGKDPIYGSQCGDCPQGSYCMAGQCEDGTPVQEACARFNEDRKHFYEGSWSGSVNSCSAASMDLNWQERSLKMTNLYRWFADLPPLKLNPALNGEQQDCALIMHANGSLSHNPGPNWKCYTQSGATGAGNSNIATMPAVEAVDLYMLDPGNPQTMGHRRWILSNWIGQTAFGSTSGYSCMATVSGNGGTTGNKAWTAWPPQGFYPMGWHSMSWTNLDVNGWTVQSDAINLSGAKVKVTANGQDKAMKVYSLAGNYGSKYAINMLPQGWKTAPNTTYKVELTGISSPISYQFQTLDCSQMP